MAIKWEYDFRTLDRDSVLRNEFIHHQHIKSWLNQLGTDGWEVVELIPGTAGSIVAWIKRPIT